jgi:membrane protein YdbS with pleckstrin-like domain
VTIGPFPALAYRRWRFSVDDEEIDIQRGRLWVERVLVPMARVQHVDTETSPLSRRLGLASVWIHTASGAFEIPALDAARAAELRVRIGRLARVSDEL